jgi:hypothetical protein
VGLRPRINEMLAPRFPDLDSRVAYKALFAAVGAKNARKGLHFESIVLLDKQVWLVGHSSLRYDVSCSNVAVTASLVSSLVRNQIRLLLIFRLQRRVVLLLKRSYLCKACAHEQ